MLKNKLVILILIISFFLSTASIVLAQLGDDIQIETEGQAGQTGQTAQTESTEEAADIETQTSGFTFGSSFGDAITQVFTFAAALVVVITIVMIMVGGVQWIVAAGGEGINKAKDRIFKALIGLTIALFSVTFLQWVNPGAVSFGPIGIQPIESNVECCYNAQTQGVDFIEGGGQCEEGYEKLNPADCNIILQTGKMPVLDEYKDPAGSTCYKPDTCQSGRCTGYVTAQGIPVAGKCIPQTNTGGEGEYCTSNSQCFNYSKYGKNVGATSSIQAFFCKGSGGEGVCSRKYATLETCDGQSVNDDDGACISGVCNESNYKYCICQNNNQCPQTRPFCDTETANCHQ